MRLRRLAPGRFGLQHRLSVRLSEDSRVSLHSFRDRRAERAQRPRQQRNAMMIRVLGCSGAIAAGCRTTSFLLDDSILIDAGTGVGDLGLDELARIDHILISHSHLDHVLAIGLLADSVMRVRSAQRRGPIVVHALPETIDALRRHIFNGVIWPDFSRLPSVEAPALRFEPFAVGDQLQLDGHRIEVLTASHTVPAVGFAVDGGEPGWWVYTGDTGPNPALWQRLASLKVAHLVIETAFSDEERRLAQLSQHLCPTSLREELSQLAGSADVHITHIKPGELHAVMAGIARFETPHRIHALQAGQRIELARAPADVLRQSEGPVVSSANNL
jgi:ribonuclease BN (tRNA processing enzyme)